jgi:hypothetical protein
MKVIPTYDKLEFEQFLAWFPKVDLPVLLGETTHHTFSQLNQPIPGAFIHRFLLAEDVAYDDEFTEFIACFQFDISKEVKALVYWEAGLLYYHYRLMVFRPDGTILQNKSLGGMHSDGSSIVRTIIQFESDLVIHTITAVQQSEKETIDLAEATHQRWQIQEDGKIVLKS